MSYEWNLTKAKKQIEYLTNELSSASKFEKEDIKDGLHFLQILTGAKTMANLKQNNGDNLTVYKRFSDYSEIVSKASIITSSVQFTDLSYSKVHKSEEEILDLTNDFYNRQNRKWKTLFGKVFNERRNNLSFSEESDTPMMLHIPYLEYFYISIPKTGDVREECSAVHEYAHAVADLINPRADGMYYKKILLEVPSLFMELISCDFFKYKSSTPMEYTIRQKQLLDTMILYFDEIYEQHSGSKIEEERTYTLASNLVSSGLDRLMYAFSYLVAIELLYIYYNNREKAIHYLDQIIQMQDQDNILEKLAALKITPGEHLNRYQKKLKKSIEKSNENQDKDEI